ncbi:MAG: hypothetical protein QNJ46_06005 [Leptolyngbyaceae cyanobacterium MO_188.B28]|nr:hypothetical protein [Leptolyngbyaceae cyanobacterium MO_188.B28]
MGDRFLGNYTTGNDMKQITVDRRPDRGSNCTIFISGEYPEGATKQQVWDAINPTFGGRFTMFGGGYYRFLAYTD